MSYKTQRGKGGGALMRKCVDAECSNYRALDCGSEEIYSYVET